jgi:hypothetical protein
LYRLLQNKKDVWSNLKFKNVYGDQPFDVEIFGPREYGLPSFLEITITDQNYENHLRMRYFTGHRHVCMTGPVTYTGTKKIGLNVSVANEARETHRDEPGKERSDQDCNYPKDIEGVSRRHWIACVF